MGGALASEFTASALMMQRWFPDTAPWVWCLLFATGLFGLNSYSVRWFGEAETWFSTIKVATIVAFLLLGAALVLGWRSPAGQAPLLGNFSTPEGLSPPASAEWPSPSWPCSTPSPAPSSSPSPPGKPWIPGAPSPAPCA
nr:MULTISPECIES: hypothetical protein [unclassified Corynebacterium]